MKNPFGNLSEEAMEDCEIDSVDDETAYLLWIGGLFVLKEALSFKTKKNRKARICEIRCGSMSL